MSCEILKERERVTVTEYEVLFWNNERGGGFGFPCDENGKMFDDLNDSAKENFQWCLKHPEEFDTWNKVKANRHSYIEPTLVRCECGEEFGLIDEYMGACECPKCGRWYNLCAQELNDPSTWREGPDWGEEDW